MSPIICVVGNQAILGDGITPDCQITAREEDPAAGMKGPVTVVDERRGLIALDDVVQHFGAGTPARQARPSGQVDSAAEAIARGYHGKEAGPLDLRRVVHD